MKILNQFQTNDMLSAAQQLGERAAQDAGIQRGIRMAVTMVATLPIIIVYPLLQKYF